jgi:ATP-binding cassette, subfamily B, bacterial HlyB/CyaB
VALGSKLVEFGSAELSWALGSICVLRQQPFAAELLEREFPPPHTETTLIRAGRALGLKVKQVRLKPSSLKRMVFPLLVGLKANQEVRPPRTKVGPNDETLFEVPPQPNLGIVTAIADDNLVLFRSGSNTPVTITVGEFFEQASGDAWLTSLSTGAPNDPDAVSGSQIGQFGFRWFVPELLKHKKVWRDVLLASLALQIIALVSSPDE